LLQNNKINEITIAALSIVYFIPLFLSANSFLNMILVLSALLNVAVVRRFKLRKFFFLTAMLIPGAISVFIAAMINTRPASDPEVIISILNFDIYRNSFDNALFLSIRTFCLSFVSILTVSVLDYEKLIYSLMQQFRLTPFIGYPLLAVFQSFDNIGEEYKKIRFAALMRGHRISPFAVILPLLVSSSRYAFQLGISIHSRGLNRDKTYLNENSFSLYDLLFIIPSVLIVITLFIFFFMNGSIDIRIL